MLEKMHADEIHTDVALVTKLVTGQFPQWAGFPIKPVRSSGTDNALYRVGTGLVVRLPRIKGAINQIAKDAQWLPKLAPHLPIAIPEQIAQGTPTDEYPYPWSIYRWIEGQSVTPDKLPNPNLMARDLARFIRSLQQIDTTSGPLATEHNLRGAPLHTRDDQTRTAIHAMKGMLDTNLTTEVWNTALQAPAWDRAPVWFHGDLLPGNILLQGDRLCAVIDFGATGIGDPACDLYPSWAIFTEKDRRIFRNELALDDATWLRGMGHALSQAVIFIPYYLHTNPIGVRNAHRQLNAVLQDFKGLI